MLVPKSTGVIGNGSNSSVSSSKKGADDGEQQEMATREGGKARVAMFTFDELCGHALSAADYLEIVRNFDTVFITDLPRLSLSEKDKVSLLLYICIVFTILTKNSIINPSNFLTRPAALSPS